MRIATYNINSVRLRQQRVLDVISEHNLDAICLQETKVIDDSFPHKGFKAAGYEHIAISGEKSYNGVAIISRAPFIDQFKLEFVNDQKRHIAVKFHDDIELHNFYIPAGGDEPDVNINPKFAHKLDYVDAISSWFSDNRSEKEKIIIVGDFNIAPLENDVWSHKQLLKVVSHTPIEVEKLVAMQESISWIDAAREFVDHEDKLYSWWSYRNRDWQKSNRGRRLDHIWVTPALQKNLHSCSIYPHHRNGEKPSDHVPVVLELKNL